MKKFFYLMLLAMMPMCFAACGDDDDNGDRGGLNVHPSPAPTPSITDLDGNSYRLLSIGNLYEFSYDTDGTLTNMNIGSKSFIVSKDAFVYSNNTTGNYGYTVNVSLGNYGYVSSLSYEYVKGNHKENGSLSFVYNDERQLISINGTVVANWVDEKQREGWKNVTIKQSNEWEKGNLVRMTVVRTVKHKEETESEESDYQKEEKYYFGYGKSTNYLFQMPFRIADKYTLLLEVDGIELLGILGFLGVGPVNFPTSDSIGYDLEYYINNNGTISNEKLVNDNYGGRNIIKEYPYIYKYEKI